MHKLLWANDFSFLAGLDAGELNDASQTLPESVEAQIAKTLTNLDAMLTANELTRVNIASIRIHLTQFGRFHARMRRRLDAHFASADGPAVSCIGVTDLPRDALVAIDVVISRSPAGS
jgi:enamine deaminase RidA (YjgF/YER057c/UK114 family)